MSDTDFTSLTTSRTDENDIEIIQSNGSDQMEFILDHFPVVSGDIIQPPTPSVSTVSVERSPTIPVPVLNTPTVDHDDSEEIDDETIIERLYGLTEMFPEWLRNFSGQLFNYSFSLKKTVKGAAWFVGSSLVILVLPILVELELSQVAEYQAAQTRQMSTSRYFRFFNFIIDKDMDYEHNGQYQYVGGSASANNNQPDIIRQDSENYYDSSTSSREILAHFAEFKRAVDDGNVILISRYYNTNHADWMGGVTLEERIDSYVNYIDLFNMVLAKEPLKLDLPDQWLWDIIEEFIYQFQSFCNFRTKLQKRTDDDVDQLKRNSKMWSIHAVLNVLHIPFHDNIDQICQTNLYKMLGYFSLIGLLKLHTLTSDYYMALKTVECIDLYVVKQYVYCQVPHCIVATNYHAGYCFTMMRRYEDAIRIFVDTLLYIQRIKTEFTTQTFQNDAVNKTGEQMLLLLSICLTLCPVRIDETLYQILREKFQDKLNKPLLTTGTDGKIQFRDHFGFACPKFISPSPTIYDQRTDHQWAEPFNKQIEVFMEEVQEQIYIPDVRSYLKLYTTLNIDKLAIFMEKTPQEVKTILLTFKHKLSGTDLSQKKDEDFQSSADIDFYVDKEIIHIADTKVTRRYSDYLVKQIIKFEELTRSISEGFGLRYNNKQ
ncbi:unnamed protein product [Didymodactylos carnosus]|uniref:Eukaryotic translation initiation factor 3 subunit L n=1 Tax=Didymodactylos carnosus TaxID=1234261 RepID=A0A814U9K2_9BILA|nr:unnamed protein product [Didymodactylos carnosus]CAF1171903.1 unnamed protein product [Didymodactylos carnosus]CAF3568273.1 unnamed protein product [Didymodactylos carnosus]CAF3935773.1 unnamed protein product [Didymodactylos carnosus]